MGRGVRVETGKRVRDKQDVTERDGGETNLPIKEELKRLSQLYSKQNPSKRIAGVSFTRRRCKNI